jgi:hypothetical protein
MYRIRDCIATANVDPNDRYWTNSNIQRTSDLRRGNIVHIIINILVLLKIRKWVVKTKQGRIPTNASRHLWQRVRLRHQA